MADGAGLPETQMTTPAPPPAKAARSGWSRGRKILVGCGGLFVLAIAGLFTLGWWINWRKAQQASQWQETGIRAVTEWLGDPDWVKQERARLNLPPSGLLRGEQPWMSEHLILFRNGEWVAYYAFCRKFDLLADDLWIGKGSDGKWYYTTYHFCLGMLMLYNRGAPPENLSSFRGEYSVREFNGDPREKLARTWPDR